MTEMQHLQPGRGRYRVAVLYRDQLLGLLRHQTWSEIVVDANDGQDALAKAQQKRPRTDERITPIHWTVIGFSADRAQAD